MTQRRQLRERLAGLDESGEIIRSMKNLAYMEAHRLGRLCAHQRAVVAHIDAMAGDFLACHPLLAPTGAPARRVLLVVGTRRGFCGAFNEHLVDCVRESLGARQQTRDIIAVGHKLCIRLARDLEPWTMLDGADVAEEIPAVLRAIVGALDEARARHGQIMLDVIHHDAEADVPRVYTLLPPFAPRAGAPPSAPPLTNLAPREFLVELGEQYLFAALHAALYDSLLAENQARVRHLDGAVRHLDERSDQLRRRMQALRQEEIIEEIEVILLNAARLDEPARGWEEDESP